MQEVGDLGWWKEQLRKHKAGRLFGPKIFCRSNGVCVGLIELWCEYKKEGKDLVGELNKPKLDPELLSKIERMQRSLGAAPTKPIVEGDREDKDAIKLEIEFEKNTGYKKRDPGGTREASLARMGNLECTEGVVTPSLSLEKFKPSLKALEKNKKHTESGVHLVEIYFNNDSAHIIAWKYHEGRFVSFDPNTGEDYFSDFEELKKHLNSYCHWCNSCNGGVKCIETQDFYFPENKPTPISQETAMACKK